MIRPIRIVPDPILSRPAKKVHTQRKDYLKEVMKDLEDTVRDHGGLGLAAPQIGIPLRMMVVDLNPPNHLYAVFINPEVKLIGEATEIGTEGCLSVPGLAAEVPRHKVIHVRWDGGHRPYQGWVARIIQHEFDHLNGVLIFDRAIIPQS